MLVCKSLQVGSVSTGVSTRVIKQRSSKWVSETSGTYSGASNDASVSVVRCGWSQIEPQRQVPLEGLVKKSQAAIHKTVPTNIHPISPLLLFPFFLSGGLAIVNRTTTS